MSTNGLRKIAFIGTGLMGAPMAHRLQGAGYAVRVWNRTPEKLGRLIAAGARPAESPAEAAAGALANNANGEANAAPDWRLSAVAGRYPDGG